MSIVLTHQEYSGWFPFHILKDDRSKPDFLPFKAKPNRMCRWWWQMTKIQLSGGISLDRSATDTDGNTHEDTIVCTFGSTFDVVPAGCHQGSDRTSPFGKMMGSDHLGGYIGFVQSVPCEITQTLTFVAGGSTTTTTTGSLLVQLYLLFISQPNQPLAGVSEVNYPASGVIVDPSGDYYPAFLFSITGGLSGPGRMPSGVITSFQSTPPTTSGGGMPIDNVGTGTIQDDDGTELVFDLNGYTGAYTPGLDDDWTGSDSVTISDLILTPKYD